MLQPITVYVVIVLLLDTSFLCRFASICDDDNSLDASSTTFDDIDLQPPLLGRGRQQMGSVILNAK